ncbi:MAG: cupin domain-containing protein [Mycobacterium sp.]
MKAIFTRAGGAALAMVMLGGTATALSHASPQADQTVSRDILQTTPVDAPVPQNAVTGVVTFPPRASAGHHLHHGVESGYVLSGDVEVIIDGQPGRIFHPGETFVTTRDNPHVSLNPGDVEARAVVTWIVDADQPLTTPVPD